MFVELCLRHTELIHLGLGRHSQPTIAGSTCQQASPEIGEGLDDTRIIPDGCLVVASPVEEQRPIVESLQVVGLIAQHKIEVFNGAVVITQLLTEQTTIVVRQEVIGIHVDCFIVILHRLTQFVAVHTHHCTIHIVVDHTRLIVDGLCKSLVGNFPVLALHVQSGKN